MYKLLPLLQPFAAAVHCMRLCTACGAVSAKPPINPLQVDTLPRYLLRCTL
jgi:hypothetical protein